MKMLSLITATTAIAALFTATGAQAAVSTCNGLQIYANGASSGLCKSLSPATQNLWVCELSGSPDIHLTFNATTNLHITVRKLSPVCEGNAQFNGTFPSALTLGQPHLICGVNVAPYLGRLNDITHPVSIATGLANAVTKGRISASVQNSYLAKAKAIAGCS